MKSRLVFWLLAMLLMSMPHAYSQSLNDTTVAIGGKISVASVISALQDGGFQALPITLQTQASPAIIGGVTTGINGVKVMVILGRCDNSKNDDVCIISFVTSFNDDKSVVNNDTLSILNQKASISKVVMKTMANGVPGFNIVYMYPCKGFEDSKFVTMVLAAFGADVGQVARAYMTLAASQAPATPPQ